MYRPALEFMRKPVDMANAAIANPIGGILVETMISDPTQPSLNNN